MKKLAFYALLGAFTILSCKQETKQEAQTDSEVEAVAPEIVTDFEIIPIAHGTAVLKWKGTTIYVDPVGGAQAFAGQPDPDVILITDIHGDHLNVETLEGLNTSNAKIMVPQAVADKLPDTFKSSLVIVNNGETKEHLGFQIEAIPMYNLREEALKFHTKGRGNGYVIEKEGKRVYFSGDTEDIPEMRALKNIDIAFICMNLPYTMTEAKAAEAVLAFKPKTVLPYHYRGTDGLSDVFAFKTAVTNGDSTINVLLMDWYPED
jgi:L-ascorbate metabolism protein UlaG (beta-lactamase superfamily)